MPARPPVSERAQTFDAVMARTLDTEPLCLDEAARYEQMIDMLDGYERRVVVNEARKGEQSRVDGSRRWVGELREATGGEWIKLKGQGQVPWTLSRVDQALMQVEGQLEKLETSISELRAKLESTPSTSPQRPELEERLERSEGLRQKLSQRRDDLLRLHAAFLDEPQRVLFADTTLLLELGANAAVPCLGGGAVEAGVMLRRTPDERGSRARVYAQGAVKFPIKAITCGVEVPLEGGVYKVTETAIGPLSYKTPHPVRGEEFQLGVAPFVSLVFSSEIVGLRWKFPAWFLPVAVGFFLPVSGSIAVGDPRLAPFRDAANSLAARKSARSRPKPENETPVEKAKRTVAQMGETVAEVHRSCQDRRLEHRLMASFGEGEPPEEELPTEARLERRGMLTSAENPNEISVEFSPPPPTGMFVLPFTSALPPLPDALGEDVFDAADGHARAAG